MGGGPRRASPSRQGLKSSSTRPVTPATPVGSPSVYYPPILVLLTVVRLPAARKIAPASTPTSRTTVLHIHLGVISRPQQFQLGLHGPPSILVSIRLRQRSHHFRASEFRPQQLMLGLHGRQCSPVPIRPCQRSQHLHAGRSSCPISPASHHRLPCRMRYHDNWCSRARSGSFLGPCPILSHHHVSPVISHLSELVIRSMSHSRRTRFICR